MTRENFFLECATEVAGAMGKAYFLLVTLKVPEIGLHELKEVREVCNEIFKCKPKNEIDRACVVYLKEMQKLCDTILTKFAGVEDLVEEMKEAMK